MKAVDVLGNAAAKGGRRHLDRVVAGLERRGVEARLIEATSPEQARAAAHQAVADGSDRLVAVGGDGVVHLAVNAVATSPTVLGVIPFGTGNDFARALGLLDGDLDTQIDRALANPVEVDAIRTSHGWVATVATLGFSGDVTARANALRWPRGQLRYTVATLLQLPRLRTLPVVVEVDGRRVGGDTTLLAVGNTAYFGGGMRICPAAQPSDGRVQVVSIAAVSRLRFLRVFPTVFSGGHVERPEVEVALGSCVTISREISGAPSEPSIDVWADGEHLGPLPIELDVVTGALSIAGARVALGVSR